MGRKGENIFHRKDGRWEARYVKGYRLDGKCQYGYLYGKSYQEVKNKRNAILLHKEELSDDKKVSDVLFREKVKLWLKRQKLSVKMSTFSYYSSVVNRHIIPVLGDICLVQINEKVILSFIEKLIHDDRLKISTVHEVIGVLKQILNFCDITIKIKLPRREKQKVMVFSSCDKKILESYVANYFDTIAIGIILSLYAGLRIGEVCALKWKNIHFLSGTVEVSKTVSRVKNVDGSTKNKTILMLSSAKTDNSIRIIPINNQILNLLQDYKTKHGISDEAFVLTSTSRFMDPRTYYNKFKIILRKCHLEKYNYHALRHTFATNCIEKGLDPKSLSEILGHSNIQITLSFYVHPDLEQKKNFMNKVFSCPDIFSQNSSKN